MVKLLFWCMYLTTSPSSLVQVVVNIFNGLREHIMEALKQHTLQELDNGAGGKP